MKHTEEEAKEYSYEYTQAYLELFLGELYQFVKDASDLHDRRTRLFIIARVALGLANTVTSKLESDCNFYMDVAESIPVNKTCKYCSAASSPKEMRGMGEEWVNYQCAALKIDVCEDFWCRAFFER